MAATAPAESEHPWALDVQEVVEWLDTDSRAGLSPEQARERLGRFGPNVLHGAPKRSRLLVFLDQFADLMIALLGAAALKHGVDVAALRERPGAGDACFQCCIPLRDGILDFTNVA